MVFILLFIFGLLVGSFLNVVIFRMERQESFVAGRSHCSHCNHQLAWYDNIPLISYGLLRGKCRYCKTRFSWQYPAVELVTACLFAGSSFLLQNSTEPVQILAGFFLLAILSFAVLITVYDLRFSLIPNAFLWGINISTASFLLMHWLFMASAPSSLLPGVQSSLLGAFLVGGFFCILVTLSRETWMGWGDVWLGVWGGMLVGLALAQVFITLSFTLGALVGLTLMYTRGKTLKTEIPFAPYILAAGFLMVACMFLAPEILYFLSPWLPGTIE
jgi:leader peptidase (prepilin peptidase)/N-methyltransferase